MRTRIAIPSQPRILITRLSAVGDCVHTMPLVGALRRRFPRSYIAWAAQPGPASLLDGYPGLDRVIRVPRDWLRSFKTVMRLRADLRSERFDVAIDPQSLTKSAMLGWLSAAPKRIGFDAPQGRELALWLNQTKVVPASEHVVDRYLELLPNLTGDARPKATFEMPRWESKQLDEFLQQPHLVNGFGVLNPGAGWDSKLWVPSRFAQVARHLHQQHGLPSVVVWAGDRERTWAEEIVARSDGSASLAAETSLRELAELMRRGRLCVAADTGPLHIAAAVGTPCVGLYGTTQPERCGPYGSQHRSVQAYYQSGSSRERRAAENEAMEAIGAKDVILACDEVIAATADERAA